KATDAHTSEQLKEFGMIGRLVKGATIMEEHCVTCGHGAHYHRYKGFDGLCGYGGCDCKQMIYPKPEEEAMTDEKLTPEQIVRSYIDQNAEPQTPQEVNLMLNGIAAEIERSNPAPVADLTLRDAIYTAMDKSIN